MNTTDPNMVMMSIKNTDETIRARNEKEMKTFLKYKTSYNEIGRYRFGAWLLTEDELEAPFNRKGIVLINTSMELTDCDEHANVEIVLANSVQKAIKSLYFHLQKEDLVLYTKEGELLLIKNNISLPKYSLKLDRKQEKTKKRLAELYLKIRNEE